MLRSIEPFPRLCVGSGARHFVLLDPIRCEFPTAHHALDPVVSFPWSLGQHSLSIAEVISFLASQGTLDISFLFSRRLACLSHHRLFPPEPLRSYYFFSFKFPFLIFLTVVFLLIIRCPHMRIGLLEIEPFPLYLFVHWFPSPLGTPFEANLLRRDDSLLLASRPWFQGSISFARPQMDLKAIRKESPSAVGAGDEGLCVPFVIGRLIVVGYVFGFDFTFRQ